MRASHRIPAILAALALGAAGCVGGSDETVTAPADGSGGEVATEQTVIVQDPSETTSRTIAEEVPASSADTGDADGTASTDDAETTTTLAEVPQPPDDPQWLDQQLQLVTVAQLDAPMALATRSGGDDLWIAERAGRIRQIQRRLSLDGGEQALRLMNTVVLDIADLVTTEGEGGLLGLAFSTDGRYLYVSYTNNRGNSVVAEYEMDAINAIRDTERILLEVEQPFSNHNGGQIAFGPDGFLYLALGDGGSGGDPLNSGQDTSTLLGSILRIDPAASGQERPYGIPPGNPFANSDGGQPEIWLWGVRNPWRFSWDAATGDLWIADVGQNRIEEVTVLPRRSAPAGKGANLGWRIMEGDQLFEGDEPPAGHVPPIYTYDHGDGRCSITGGYVYRGDLNRALAGTYVFGDFCTGEVFGLQTLSDGRTVVANLLFDRATSNVISFGEASDGELYLLEGDGRVSLIRLPGVGPRPVIVDSDDRIPGGEIDDGVVPDDGTGGG